MNKKILLVSIFATLMLLVPFSSAYGINGFSVINNEENKKYNIILNDTWAKVIDYTSQDIGNSVLQTTDSGYIVLATIHGAFGGTAAWVFKTNSKGKKIWEETYGRHTPDRDTAGNSIIQTNDGNFIMTGWLTTKVWLGKIGNNGKKIWEKNYQIRSYGEGYDVLQTPDGAYFIVGGARSHEAGGDSNIFLLKTDDSGNKIFKKEFHKGSNDEGYSIKQTSDGGFIIVGRTDFYGYTATWLLKTDSNGSLLWEKIYDLKNYNIGYSVQIADDGGYIITGCTRPHINSDMDILLMKTDSNGNLLWDKKIGGEYKDVGYSVQIADDGGYIITGISYKNRYNCNAILVKVHSKGYMEWSKTYGGPYKDHTKSVHKTNDGGFILTGVCQRKRTYFWDLNKNDLCLIKTDSFGNAPPLINLINNSKMDMPKNKIANNNLFMIFLEQFPILQKILLLQR